MTQEDRKMSENEKFFANLSKDGLSQMLSAQKSAQRSIPVIMTSREEVLKRKPTKMEKQLKEFIERKVKDQFLSAPLESKQLSLTSKNVEV